ncbi:heavy metal translocating P-type ATPase, partial [Enterococcus hirae]
TEKATVSYADGVAPDTLIGQVEAAGYSAALPPPPADTANTTTTGETGAAGRGGTSGDLTANAEADSDDTALRSLRQRL